LKLEGETLGKTFMPP